MYASVDEITGKAINEAPEFAELEKTVIVFNSKVLTASSMVNSICDNNITVFFAVPSSSFRCRTHGWHVQPFILI